MIPKVIHWCWFGRGMKTPLVEKCVASWKAKLPDYQIKEWNEDNFDVRCNKYVEEAYDNRKWAFVTDFVRVHALYHEGGIYMDSDVEVLKSLDGFLSLPAFSGRESANGSLTGTMGSEKGGRWVKDLLDDYENRRFVRQDGSFDYTTNVDYCDERLIPLGLQKEDEEFEVPGYVRIFKQEVFCPKSWKDGTYAVTRNSFTIHHFATSWHPEDWGPGRVKALKWVRNYVGYVPMRILALVWDNPLSTIKRIIAFIVRQLR